VKLIDFRTHFIERLTPPWLTGNPEQNTADKIIYGSPEREIAPVWLHDPWHGGS